MDGWMDWVVVSGAGEETWHTRMLQHVSKLSASKLCDTKYNNNNNNNGPSQIPNRIRRQVLCVCVEQ